LITVNTQRTRNTMRVLALLSLVLLSGCALTARLSALELIIQYDCHICLEGECKLVYEDKEVDCVDDEDDYICCTENVPEEHRYIFDCAYEPLIT